MRILFIQNTFSTWNSKIYYL